MLYPPPLMESLRVWYRTFQVKFNVAHEFHFPAVQTDTDVRTSLQRVSSTEYPTTADVQHAQNGHSHVVGQLGPYAS